MTDPLKSLLLDGKEVDRARLAQGLADILGVDQNDGRLVLKPGFNALSTRHRVLAYLLGVKASHLLGLAEREDVANKEIIESTGMPPGTVNPKISELRDARLVTKTDKGTYWIAGPQVLPALSDLAKSKGAQTS